MPVRRGGRLRLFPVERVAFPGLTRRKVEPFRRINPRSLRPPADPGSPGSRSRVSAARWGVATRHHPSQLQLLQGLLQVGFPVGHIVAVEHGEKARPYRGLRGATGPRVPSWQVAREEVEEEVLPELRSRGRSLEKRASEWEVVRWTR